MVVGPNTKVVYLCNTFWNADIIALAGLYIDKKCCLDILSNEKGHYFYKADGANVPNGELVAGIVCVSGPECFAGF